MKTKLTALMTAVTMLTSASAITPVQAADVNTTDTDISTIPEWIPTSFEEALNFRNTYGATHIGKNEKDNDTVCLVYQKFPQNEYTLHNGNEEMDEIFRETFTDDSSQLMYEVVAYTLYHQNAGACYFSIDFADETNEYVYDYHFASYGSGGIDEKDVYSWLPDCKTEYDEYIKKNGEVSVNNGYVVFCLEKNADTPYSWGLDNNSDISSINEYYISDCNEESIIPLDGGKECRIEAISFKEDGRAKIKFDLTLIVNRPFKPEDIVKSLSADCMVLDDCKTILLNGNVRYTFKDCDTGKNLNLPNNSVKMDVSPSIGYKADAEGVYIYEDTQATADSNPYIWRNISDKTPDVFDVELNEKAIPYGYTLPEEYKTVTKYDNGSYDVEFRLKQDENCLAPGTVRVTLYDKDTGELIPEDMFGLHPFTVGTDIRFKAPSVPGGWMMTGPVLMVKSNPYVCKDNLPNLYRDADYFAFTSKYEPEVKLYDNNSMDIIFRMKFDSYGDINGDGGFNIADLLIMEKWLLTGKCDEYLRWYDVDFCSDGKIDIFDLCIMRKKLLETMNNTYTDFDVKYIQTQEINGHAGYPQRNLITSTDDLQSYIDSKTDILDLSEFKEASKDYNEEWFKDHKLLVIAFESTVNIKHKVTGIIIGKTNQYTNSPNDYVQIECQIPEEGSYGQLINHPQMLIELDSSFEINENFNVDFIDVNAAFDN